MGRILAIDYGRRRVGLAVSDPLKITAQGLPTLLIDQPGEIISWVIDQQQQRDIELIVLGLPRALAGGMGAMADEVLEFSRLLAEKTGLPVKLVDERLTSREAHQTFALAGKKLKGRKAVIDKIAATLLLEHYLETINPGTGNGPDTPNHE
jgi:putative Holliday junction resolvase